jgi:Protein of unknown function (DUF3768)
VSAEHIRSLNDAFRTTLDPRLGRVMLTAGVDALSNVLKAMLLERVRTFDAFTEDNDPHAEHDFGSIEFLGRKFFWKLDYYDPTLTYGSEDPADPAKTTRVLTIMLAEEY